MTTSIGSSKDYRELQYQRDYTKSQNAILDRLYNKFPLTDKYDLRSANELITTFAELTNTTIHNHNLSTRIIAISTNDEYLQFFREIHLRRAEGLRLVYYEFNNTEFSNKWYYQATYWRFQILEKIVQAFRTDYKVFIPNACYPIILEAKGVYVVVAPVAFDRGETYKLEKAFPDATQPMDAYDKIIQDQIKAGFKWKIEFQKNDNKGIWIVFGYYTSKPRAYAMGSIISDQGNTIKLSKIEVAKDSQYSEAKLFD